MTNLVIRQYTGGRWVPMAPVTAADQIVMADGIPLSDYLAEQEPDSELVTISHGLDGYPSMQLLAIRYAAGVGGAGEGPAGGDDPVQCAFRLAYPSRDSLTVLVLVGYALPGTARTLTQIGELEYRLTLGSGTYSYYLRVLPLQSPGAVPAQLYISPVTIS